MIEFSVQLNSADTTEAQQCCKQTNSRAVEIHWDLPIPTPVAITDPPLPLLDQFPTGVFHAPAESDIVSVLKICLFIQY